jgi:hypothetical protein
MYSDERTQGLAPAQPVLQYEDSQDQRQERMRQLANIAIDIFLASRPGNHDEPRSWVN